MPEFLDQNTLYVLGSGAILLAVIVAFALLRRRKTRRNPESLLIEVSTDIGKIYENAYARGSQIIAQAEQKTMSDVSRQIPEFEKRIGKLIEELEKDFNSKRRFITEQQSSFDKALSELEEKISTITDGEIAHTQQSAQTLRQSLEKISAKAEQGIDLEVSGFVSQFQELHRNQVSTLEKSTQQNLEQIQSLQAQLVKLNQAEQEAADKLQAERAELIEQARTQTQEIVSQTQEQAKSLIGGIELEYKTFIEELKTATKTQLTQEKASITDTLQGETEKTLSQLREIVAKTQDTSWHKIEEFNQQLLTKFQTISDTIVSDSETRAKKIGQKVLEQVENGIVLFVISVIKETLNLALTPEQHQDLIMDAVKTLKHEVEKGTLDMQQEEESEDEQSGQAINAPGKQKGGMTSGPQVKVVYKVVDEAPPEYNTIDSPFFKIGTLPEPENDIPPEVAEAATAEPPPSPPTT